MPDWSIKIVPAENPTTDVPAAFVPDLSGAQPGTPLTAQVDDIVTWNNTTNAVPTSFAVNGTACK